MSYIAERIRKYVFKRALFMCEYCHLKEDDAYYSHQIEHIISLKHGGETILSNLALACSYCNNFKGSDLATMLLPDKTLIRLFHPRDDKWDEHFEVNDCVFFPKSKVGEATIKVLKMNDIDRIIERRLVAER
jgi:hypothetical protein